MFTAVGLPEWVLDSTPQLTTEEADGLALTRSLIQGAVDEILQLSSKALYQPNPGAGLGIGADPAAVAKAAGSALTRSAITLAGNVMGGGLFDGLNRVATTQYERRVGVGSLLLAHRLGGHSQLEQSEGDFRRFASAIHQVACDV